MIVESTYLKQKQLCEKEMKLQIYVNELKCKPEGNGTVILCKLARMETTWISDIRHDGDSKRNCDRDVIIMIIIC